MQFLYPGIFIFVVANMVIIPSILSWSNPITDTQIQFKEFEIKSENPETIHTDTFKNVNHSYIDLIKGTTSYNNGDYIIYLGSDSCPWCNKLLYGEEDKPNYQRNLTFSLSNSHWGVAYQAINHTLSKNIKFIFYSDKTPKSSSGNYQNILPWSKHSTTNINFGQIKGDYIRNDESAIKFRKIRSTIHKHYPIWKSSSIPTVILYKKGEAMFYGYDNFPSLEIIKDMRKKEWEKNNPPSNGQQQQAYESKKNDFLEYVKVRYHGSL